MSKYRIELTTPRKRYAAAGRCAYCKRRHSKLTDEHIIPFSLAGNSLVFAESSCLRCQKKTHLFETIYLQEVWRPFRSRIGAPTRGKDKNDGFSLKRMKVTSFDTAANSITYEKVSADKVAAEEYPFYYFAYKFLPPAVLSARGAEDDLCESFLLINDEEFRKHCPTDKDGFRIAPGRPEAFCAMLAKIAHSYAIAELGFEAFNPRVAWFIRGADARILYWLGSDQIIPPPSEALHEIGLRKETFNGIDYAVVSLRLFCPFGTPRYDIVVGELEPGHKESSLLQKPLHAIHVKTAIPFPHLVPVVT
jgi:hypothetical protein